MKRPALLIVLLLVLAMPAMAVAQGTDRTTPHNINAVLEGSFTFVLHPPYGFTDVWALGVTRGTVQGLGLTNLFTFQMPTDHNTVENGRFFLVAANGDRINGMYEGWTEVDETFTHFTGHAEWVITGGTGRFAHASGTIHVTAHLTSVSMSLEWPVVWMLEGTINY